MQPHENATSWPLLKVEHGRFVRSDMGDVCVVPMSDSFAFMLKKPRLGAGEIFEPVSGQGGQGSMNQSACSL